MDNSRNVLQAPAETSNSGRFFTPNPHQQREGLLAQLLFAARDLARHQFSRRLFSTQTICIECRHVQVNADFLEHADLCRTGRVLRVLKSLLALPQYQISTERSASREISSEPVTAAVEERPRSLPVFAFFGEPWAVSDSGEITNIHGTVIVDPTGSELALQDEIPYMQRIVDCVNTCSGFDGQSIQKLIGGEQ